jgi:hypothetical protein
MTMDLCDKRPRRAFYPRVETGPEIDRLGGAHAKNG